MTCKVCPRFLSLIPCCEESQNPLRLVEGSLGLPYAGSTLLVTRSPRHCTAQHSVPRAAVRNNGNKTGTKIDICAIRLALLNGFMPQIEEGERDTGVYKYHQNPRQWRALAIIMQMKWCAEDDKKKKDQRK